MRYAIISDIHANGEALIVVERALNRLSIDRVICLGDIVGYNADPDFCLGRVKNLSDFMIRGNHDKAVAGLIKYNDFNYNASQAVRWTQVNIQAATLTRLKGLPAGPLLIDQFFLACHGAPEDEDKYIINSQKALASIYYLKKNFAKVRICFFGHTHLPAVWSGDGKFLPLSGSIRMQRELLYLVNPGSVGQPRDNDPRASFGVFDSGTWTFEHYRLDYPITETQQKILQNGLAPALAERLSWGM